MAFTFALGAFAATAACAQTTLPREVKHSPSPSHASASEPSAAARAAFQTLSEDDRKALQDALGWLGFYNGVIDGGYGKRTIDSLVAYQQNVGLSGDGVATAEQLIALRKAADKTKTAIGFKILDDPATGVRIGAPTQLFEKREGGPGFASLASKEGEIRLDLKETSGKLAALFKFLTADAPGHKFTYKVMKPDVFFVIAGEEGDKKFYRRYVAAPPNAADPDKLRGFMFVYPKARAKALDPLALAIANSFDPFPAPTPVAVTPSPPPIALSPPPVASATPVQSTPKLTATALVVAPGVAVTTLPPSQCGAPTINGKPARFLDPAAAGLSRLGGDFGDGATPPAVGQGGDDLIALSVAGGGDANATLQVASAATLPGAGSLKVVAAFAPEAVGAPLFDRQGRLVAFVAPFEAVTRRAGVVLAEPHATVPATDLGAGGPPPSNQVSPSAPDIAARMRGAVVGVFCGA